MATSSNAVIGWPRWTSYATFTADGGSTDATYVPANLGTDDLSFVWRSPNLTATNTKFLAVFSRPSPIQLFALVGHNLTRNATFRLRLYSDTGATTQIYDSGDTAVWPRVFSFGSLPWNDNRCWTGQFNDLEITGLRWNRPLWLDKLYLARAARCAISDPNNPAGYAECGLAEFSQGWPVSINFSYGAQYGWNARTQTVQGIGGRKQFERRDKPRRFQGTIQYLPRDEAMAQGFELQRQADLDVPFFWLPDPTSTTNLIRESYLARNAELGMLSYASPGRDSMPISLEEAL